MTIEDIADAELQQHYGAVLPRWYSTESSPAAVINSPAFEAPPVGQVVSGAGAGWEECGVQLLAAQVVGHLQTHSPWNLVEVRGILEAHGAPARGPDLDAALSDLAQASDEAREDGFEPPPELALRSADRLLRDMYAHRQCRFEVYPTQDREVAIYAPEGERSLLVLCGPDGSVRCSVNLNGKHCRAYYDPAFPGGIPAGFLRDALAALDVA
jgi:hypothetical protein